MSAKRTRSTMALTALLVGILLAAGAVAQEGDGEGGQGMMGSMPEACKAMMAKHQAMREKAEAMDARLDELVAAMDAASGRAKVDAVAAVVDELVAQRRQRHQGMMAMHPETGRMGMGMMQGMPACPCPMMQGMQGEAEGPAGDAGGHAEHHPQG